MFGYVTPLIGELKIKELEGFRACYCGLCRELGKKYGFAARFILNYDFTFLSMLLWERDACFEYEFHRCPVSPIKKKCMCVKSGAFDAAAGYSVIFTYWKLMDAIKDEGFFGSLKARTFKLFLNGAYKKAARNYPEFNSYTISALEGLSELEKEESSRLDAAADKFAMLLSRAAMKDNGNTNRPLEQVLYHTGRFIYIADAINDLKEDRLKGGYNPVSKRFDLRYGELTKEAKESLDITLSHSYALISSAFELMPDTCWSGVLRNIVYFGIPDIKKRVLNGTFKNTKAHLPKRP